MKKASAILALVLCVSLLLVGCGGNSAASPLVGKWSDKNSGMTTMEFGGDGSMKMYVLNELVMTSTYKVDGDKLTITAEGVESTATFKINGSELTITDPSSNQSVVYKKQ